MGVKGLKSFLAKNLKSIVTRHVSLSQFSGKKVAVDLTNLLYRFMSRPSYILEFVNLIHKFGKYGIELIFVMDGRPDELKNYVLTHRKAFRDKMQKKLDDIKEQASSGDNVECEELEVQEDMIKTLTKKTIVIKPQHINECKGLFERLGVKYIHFPDIEADLILTYMVQSGNADMAFSGDMDLMVHGCPMLIQDLDFMHDQVILLDFNLIISELNLTVDEFKYACILSGTDYNNSLRHSNIETNIELIRTWGTIPNVIANLDTINKDTQPEYHKSLPSRFDWESALFMFSESISPDIIYTIKETIDKFDIMVNDRIYLEPVHDEFVKNISQMIFELQETRDPNLIKYVKKILDFVYWNYNIRIEENHRPLYTTRRRLVF